MPRIFLLLGILAGNFVTADRTKSSSHPSYRPLQEADLDIADLLVEYNANRRPKNGGKGVIVLAAIKPQHISTNSNGNPRECLFIFELREEWTDTRLMFGGFHAQAEHLYIDLSGENPKIWTPDTYFPGTISVSNNHPGFIRIHSNGQIRRSRPFVVRKPGSGGHVVAGNGANGTNGTESGETGSDSGTMWNCTLDVGSYKEVNETVGFVWKEGDDGLHIPGDDELKNFQISETNVKIVSQLTFSSEDTKEGTKVVLKMVAQIE